MLKKIQHKHQKAFGKHETIYQTQRGHQVNIAWAENALILHIWMLNIHNNNISLRWHFDAPVQWSSDNDTALIVWAKISGILEVSIITQDPICIHSTIDSCSFTLNWKLAM